VCNFTAALVVRRGPGKHRQAQVDSRGIQRIDGLRQIDAKGFGHIEPAGAPDQVLGKLRVNPPVPDRVGIGQRVARDMAPNAHVVELGRLRPQTGLDVAQALPIRQLRKRHAQKLIQAREGLDLVLSLVASHAPAKGGQWQMLHHLSEDEFALVHRSLP